MNLHLDKAAFLALISNISERTSLRSDVIEKDYYITLMLWELSQKQDTLPAYFKGGTALYKALKSLNRFSEDIDLTVEIKDCSNSQKKKRLEAAANKYESLQRTTDRSREENTKGSITSVYEYEPITSVDAQDELQRFRFVKVEATSFTISEPYEELEIEPILYTYAIDNEKEILKNQFNTAPFSIKTIKIERIFVDKILAAEFYYQRNQLFDVSKHLYDLAILLKQPKIQALISNRDDFETMLNYKRLEEQERIGSDLADKPFREFTMFAELISNKKLKQSFEKMQSNYVFNDKDIIKYEDMVSAMETLNEHLLELDMKLAQEFEMKIEM